MLLALLYQLVRYLTDLALVRTQSDAQLRAEVLALRHQLRVSGAEGRQASLAARRSPPARRVAPALVAIRLGCPATQTGDLLRWHRELVRRKWAAFAGRPPRPGSARHRERRELVLRLAQENPLEYPVIRHMNNLESVFSYEGTNETHTLAIGEAIAGIPAYRW